MKILELPLKKEWYDMIEIGAGGVAAGGVSCDGEQAYYQVEGCHGQREKNTQKEMRLWTDMSMTSTTASSLRCSMTRRPALVRTNLRRRTIMTLGKQI